jgi:acetyltransferase-like isoleucine patch superfamily enzyme
VSARESLRRALKAPVKGAARAALRLMKLMGGMEAINRVLLVSGGNTAFVLRTFGATIGAGERIESPLIVHNAECGYSNLTIGRDCYVGKDVLLDLRNPVVLDDRVTVSMRTTIVTHLDVGSSPLKDEAYPVRDEPVFISDGAYVGACAVLLSGVTIGERSVVAAGAVVTTDVPAGTVVAGVPAKHVRSIADDASRAVHLASVGGGAR